MAATLAVVIFSVLSGVLLGLLTLDQYGWSGAVVLGLTYGLVAGGYAALAAGFIGTPLAFLAHLLLKNVRRQSVHVLVFGGVGLLASLGPLAALEFLDGAQLWWAFAACAAASTAASRFIVGRHQHRQGRAAGALDTTPLPAAGGGLWSG